MASPFQFEAWNNLFAKEMDNEPLQAEADLPCALRTYSAASGPIFQNENLL